MAARSINPNSLLSRAGDDVMPVHHHPADRPLAFGERKRPGSEARRMVVGEDRATSQAPSGLRPVDCCLAQDQAHQGSIEARTRAPWPLSPLPGARPSSASSCTGGEQTPPAPRALGSNDRGPHGVRRSLVEGAAPPSLPSSCVCKGRAPRSRERTARLGSPRSRVPRGA